MKGKGFEPAPVSTSQEGVGFCYNKAGGASCYGNPLSLAQQRVACHSKLYTLKSSLGLSISELPLDGVVCPFVLVKEAVES